MLSSLASYIFGGSENADEQPVANPTQQPAQGRKASNEDEWVVLGSDVQPALTLGSLDDVAPRPSTGSTGSSEAPSELGANEDDDEMVIVEENGDHSGPREITLTRSARRLTSPLSCPNGVSLPQMKALRASQKSKQKETTKHLTSKATERHNKAVKIRSNHPGKKSKAASHAIKASGFNKHLKQC